jgi:hypothetical protein
MFKILEKNGTLFHLRTQTTLKYIVAECRVAEASDAISRASEGLEQLHRDLKTSKERLAILKSRAKESYSKYVNHKNKVEDKPELQELFDQEITVTMDELEGELADLEAREGLINEVDPAVLTEYTNRLKQVYRN